MKPKANDEYKHIGRVLRNYRIMHHKNRESISQILGVTHQQVKKYEDGLNRICFLYIKKLLEYYSISFDKFLSDINNNECLAPNRSNLLNYSSLIKEFDKLPKDLQMHVVHYIKSLVNITNKQKDIDIL